MGSYQSQQLSTKKRDEYVHTDELVVLNLGQYNRFENNYVKMLDVVLSNQAATVSECSDPLVSADPYHPALIIRTSLFEISLLKSAPCIKHLYEKVDYDSINSNISAQNWVQEF